MFKTSNDICEEEEDQDKEEQKKKKKKEEEKEKEENNSKYVCCCQIWLTYLYILVLRFNYFFYIHIPFNISRYIFYKNFIIFKFLLRPFSCHIFLLTSYCCFETIMYP